jgi:hypothetical protein
MCALLLVLAGIHPAPATAATHAPHVIIGAVLPNPASGPEWVMLEVTEQIVPHKRIRVFLPIALSCVDCMSPIQQIGQPPALTHVDMSGWKLGFAGMWYTLPANLPPLPAGAKVMVNFDGQGASANDMDLRDGVMHLHTPTSMVNVLPNTAGKLFLFAGDVNTPDNLRAQYEWGVGTFDFGFRIAD